MALGFQIYLRFGIRLLVDPFQFRILNNVFNMRVICKNDASTFCMRIPKDCDLRTVARNNTLNGTREELWERGTSVYGEMPSDLEGKRVELPTYPQFQPWIVTGFLSEFRKRMRFHDRVVSGATRIVNKARDKYNCSVFSSCVLVVVHMRMEDYPKHLTKTTEGAVDLMSKTDYLPNAFDYAQRIYS
ncbi:uncharacterized protein LOC142356330, partial [Convolutriloba macropyga]|uniref:uncharacterized protein LOC142356330 n=1 Tax=Convolutriloba macropyga TaxID=536237 RepID=UPI003F523623